MRANAPPRVHLHVQFVRLRSVLALRLLGQSKRQVPRALLEQAQILPARRRHHEHALRGEKRPRPGLDARPPRYVPIVRHVEMQNLLALRRCEGPIWLRLRFAASRPPSIAKSPRFRSRVLLGSLESLRLLIDSLTRQVRRSHPVEP